MAFLLAQEQTEQLPRIMVGGRVAAFELDREDVEERGGRLVTVSPVTSSAIPLEYDSIDDALASIKKNVDAVVVKTMLSSRTLPHIMLDVFHFDGQFGVDIRAITIGEALAICVASCYAVDDEEDDEDDEDDDETLVEATARVIEQTLATESVEE